MSIQIFCRILLPSPWYNFVQNVISSSVDGNDYVPQISSKSIQYLCQAKNANVSVDNGLCHPQLGEGIKTSDMYAKHFNFLLQMHCM